MDMLTTELKNEFETELIKLAERVRVIKEENGKLQTELYYAGKEIQKLATENSFLEVRVKRQKEKMENDKLLMLVHNIYELIHKYYVYPKQEIDNV